MRRVEGGGVREPSSEQASWVQARTHRRPNHHWQLRAQTCVRACRACKGIGKISISLHRSLL